MNEQEAYERWAADEIAKHGERPEPPVNPLPVDDRQGATYLGDGLYAKFDGYHVQLFAHNGIVTYQRVFLDPVVLSNFQGWLTAMKEARDG